MPAYPAILAVSEDNFLSYFCLSNAVPFVIEVIMDFDRNSLSFFSFFRQSKKDYLDAPKHFIFRLILL